MKIFKNKLELHQWIKTLKKQSIGFVPTMGALHAGHLSLVKASKKDCDKTIVSIFINKLQFSPDEDFNSYPRLVNQDIKQLKNEKIDALFYPEQQEMYPEDLSFKIQENKITNELEGKSRPDFFSGVCLVVLKLFNIIQPHRAYFGEKDIQQLCVIQKMIKDFNMPVQLCRCPTVREENGLAMSSRNQYLSPSEKDEAALFYQLLKKGITKYLDGQEPETIVTILYEKMNINENIKVDYFEFRDLNTFSKLTSPYNGALVTLGMQEVPVVLVGAIYYKQVRLIDNIILK